MKRSLHLESETEPNAHPPESAQEWEQLYADEKALLERSVAIPLVAFPDYVALSDAVRDWTPAPWGEWRVADVWLDRGDKGATAVGDSGSAAAGARP